MSIGTVTQSQVSIGIGDGSSTVRSSFVINHHPMGTISTISNEALRVGRSSSGSAFSGTSDIHERSGGQDVHLAITFDGSFTRPIFAQLGLGLGRGFDILALEDFLVGRVFQGS